MVLNPGPEVLRHVVCLGDDNTVQAVLRGHPPYVAGHKERTGPGLPALDGDVPPGLVSEHHPLLEGGLELNNPALLRWNGQESPYPVVLPVRAEK